MATTCDFLTRSAMCWYNGSTTSATSPHHTDCVAREISKLLPLKNIFQPIEWQVIGELASHDESQKPWTGKAFLDRGLCFGGYLDLRFSPLCSQLGHAYFFPYVLEAFKVSRNVLDLLVFLAADLFAFHAATWAAPLLRTQLKTCVVTGRFSKFARARRPLRRFTRCNSGSGSVPRRSSNWIGLCSKASANSSSICASWFMLKRSARGP